MPHVGEAPQDEILVVETGSALGIEEKHEGTSAVAEVEVAIAVAVGIVGVAVGA